jgi:hypothetical protein
MQLTLSCGGTVETVNGTGAVLIEFEACGRASKADVVIIHQTLFGINWL